jgi:hypothetical protein
MNKIGLIITINKFKHYWETSQTTMLCESMDKAKDKLVDHLAKEFSNLNIDYPLELSDFEYHWFGQQYVKSNAFNYKLFMEGVWHEPWEHQDIYSDVLDKMQANEEADPPNFDEIYGEPDPDENAIDHFSMEKNEYIYEFEKKLTEIIKQSKTANFKEDQVKECKCEKCKENHEEQSTKENTQSFEV